MLKQVGRKAIKCKGLLNLYGLQEPRVLYNYLEAYKALNALVSYPFTV
jgi:hypothetical protein